MNSIELILKSKYFFNRSHRTQTFSLFIQKLISGNDQISCQLVWVVGSVACERKVLTQGLDPRDGAKTTHIGVHTDTCAAHINIQQGRITPYVQDLGEK